MRVMTPKLPNRQQSHRPFTAVASRPVSQGLNHMISLPYSRHRFHYSNSKDTNVPSIPNAADIPSITDQQRAFGKAVRDAKSLEDISKLLTVELNKDKLLKSQEQPQNAHSSSFSELSNNFIPRR